MKKIAPLAVPAILILAAGALPLSRHAHHARPAWTKDERATLATFALGTLGPPPADPSNRRADDVAAARLGRELFFDEELSASGTVSCATCHQPGKAFTDGLPLSKGEGTSDRNAPSIATAAWSSWQFWDGRRDSAWAQALVPLESRAEHGISRTDVVLGIASRHASAYRRIFGALPDVTDARRFRPGATPLGLPAQRAAWDAMSQADRDAVDEAFANAGKAIEAYERRLRLKPSRFDEYVLAAAAGRDSTALDDAEARGLAVFVRNGKCVQCHSGPLLTNGEFHGIAVPDAPGRPHDAGRLTGVVEAMRDPFNCLGPHSDAAPEQCEELRFVKAQGQELDGAMRVPSLRNVARTGPYMHDGSMATLGEVIEHYDRPPAAMLGHSDLVPLKLGEGERADLEAFLRALDSDVVDDLATPAPSQSARAHATPGLGLIR